MQNTNTKLAAVIAHFGRAGLIVLCMLAIAVFMQLGMGGDNASAQAPDILITSPAAGDNWFENQTKQVRWEVPSSLFASKPYDAVDAVYYLEQTGDSRPIGAQRVNRSDVGDEIVFNYIVGQSGELGIFEENETPLAHIRLFIEPVDGIDENGFSAPNSADFTLEQIQHDGSPLPLMAPKLTIQQLSYNGHWLQKQEQNFFFDLADALDHPDFTLPVTAELVKEGTTYVLGTIAYKNGQDLNFTSFMPANLTPGEAVLRLRPGNPGSNSYIDGRHTKLVHIHPAKTITITQPANNGNLYRGEGAEIKFTATNIPQGNFYTYPENMDVELVTIAADGTESQKESIVPFGVHSGFNGENIIQVTISPDLPQYANDSTTYLRVKSRINSNPSTDGLINVRVVERDRNQDIAVDVNHAGAIAGHGLVFTPLEYNPEAKPQVQVSVWVKNDGIADLPATKLRSSAAFSTDGEEMKGDFRMADVPAIPAGESVLVSLGTYEADTYQFFYMLILDHDQAIYESNEANNTIPPTSIDLAPYQTTIAVRGTYYSKGYPVTTGDKRWASWENFRAVYNDQLNSETETKFAIAFYKADGQKICQTGCGALGFDNTGHYLVQVEKSYNPTDGESGEVDLTGLNGITGMNQVATVKFRIQMATSAYAEAESNQPWVQSVEVNYNTDRLGEVGIVFGQQIVTVQRGGSTTYTFDMNRVDPTFTGRVNWAVTNGAPDPRLTITPSSGFVTFGATDNTKSGSVTIAAASDIPADTRYPFVITAIPEDTGKSFRALDIGVTVRTSNSLFTLNATPLVASVASGQDITFSISAVRQPGFTAEIDLSDTIFGTFGDDVEQITYTPTSKKIAANSNGPVTIKIATADDVTNHSARNFKVMGNTPSGEVAEVSIQLTITSAGDPGDTKDVSIVLTAPVEWALTQGGQKIPQTFTFRIYNSANASDKKEVTNLVTDAQDKVTVPVEDLKVGGAYRGFIRSARHLWREAGTPITISASQNNYSMSFTRLIVGDIHPNNAVNALDVSTFGVDWGKTGTLVSDFDGNGSVNALDVVAIFTNYFKTGPLLPS